MLPKANRLHTSQQIYKVRKEGTRFFSEFVTMYSLPSEENQPQFAFIVSNKVSKLATQRNRTKRLLRQSVHELLPKLKPSFVVLVAKTNLADVPLQAVSKELQSLLQKAGLLNT